jgi:hypothetical protein
MECCILYLPPCSHIVHLTNHPPLLGSRAQFSMALQPRDQLTEKAAKIIEDGEEGHCMISDCRLCHEWDSPMHAIFSREPSMLHTTYRVQLCSSGLHLDLDCGVRQPY